MKKNTQFSASTVGIALASILLSGGGLILLKPLYVWSIHQFDGPAGGELFQSAILFRIPITIFWLCTMPFLIYKTCNGFERARKLLVYILGGLLIINVLYYL